jgi:anti-sigma regulatory factor (Ser/Thr protein kinase)
VLSEAPSRAGIEDDVALLAVRRVAMHAGPLEIELPAEPESVPIARKRFRRWLSDVDGASEQEAFDITLALNEACTNTVQHAYGPDRGHTFRVRAEQRGESVLLEVADSGRWRPRRRSRGGRGLLIIEQLMDEVSVERSATGTTLRMRRERAEQQ